MLLFPPVSVSVSVLFATQGQLVEVRQKIRSYEDSIVSRDDQRHRTLPGADASKIELTERLEELQVRLPLFAVVVVAAVAVVEVVIAICACPFAACCVSFCCCASVCSCCRCLWLFFWACLKAVFCVVSLSLCLPLVSSVSSSSSCLRLSLVVVVVVAAAAAVVVAVVVVVSVFSLCVSFYFSLRLAFPLSHSLSHFYFFSLSLLEHSLNFRAICNRKCCLRRTRTSSWTAQTARCRTWRQSTIL